MLKIYLGDLVYDTIRINYVVPLNVAYIASYTKEKYRCEVDIKIFKYPKDLENALKNSSPDILGLSHYSWNVRLNRIFIEMAKQLKPDVITVMGGPNVRTEPHNLREYLSTYTSLDYYVLYEGEEPFGDLVGEIIGGGNRLTPPPGCAAIVDGELFFEPVVFRKKARQIDLPSPYLTGFLDSFLLDSNMIPLLETNRGCPFHCVYCVWGIVAHSRVRQRPLEMIYEEMDYIAEKSVGQVNWIFCDANFGLLPRDVDIARKIRKIMDEKGYPVNVALYHSKNTSKRNIEIVKILRDAKGYIAIQSTDPVVLENSGRGDIDMNDLEKHIGYYKNENLEVMTDILIGLPGESAKKHLSSLVSAFDMGFDGINPYNIRMLLGSKYEGDEYRKKYGVKTKYRPIFGAYGIYDGRLVFELEESVRATKDMTETELDGFKVIHWLIYFFWNTGIFKPLLRFGQQYEVNPGIVLYKLFCSKHPLLEKAFGEMRERSMAEWFSTPEEMIHFYEQRKNFDELVENFVKLNFLYIAQAYQSVDIFSVLLSELSKILTMELKENEEYSQIVVDSLISFIDKYVCKDLLQKEFSVRDRYMGEVVSYILNDRNLLRKKSIEIEIYRPKQYVDFCNYHLNPGGKKDFSLQNLSRFLEIGGMKMLTNKVRVIQMVKE